MLEHRITPSTFTVMTTADSGLGSFRQAILDSNANSGTDTIAFDIGGGGIQTIQPTSALPEVTGPVVIDGTTQPSYAGSPFVVLDCSSFNDGSTGYGLWITAGDSTVRGLVINGVSGADIRIENGGNNLIVGNYLGTDVNGAVAVPGNANTSNIGVLVLSDHNTIGGTTELARNLISGHNFYGVYLSGADATDNNVRGNFIGMDVTGTLALGNYGGVVVEGGTSNLIGGVEAGAGNVISGNLTAGVGMIDADDNQVQGNLIGTDVTGLQPLGNRTGIYVQGGSGDVIGGAQSGAGNIISASTDPTPGAGYGVIITNSSSGHAHDDQILGNYIGTDVTGNNALPNNSDGIRVDFDSFGITIGGTSAAARNLVSGNKGTGINVTSGHDNAILGNYVGINSAGTDAIPNGSSGVIVGGSHSTVGGIAVGAGNLLSGNKDYGLFIGGSQIEVQGNRIGTNAAGTSALPNTFGGVGTGNGASNMIGGTAPGAGNLISGNARYGIRLLGPGGNQVKGNLIGTDLTGTLPLGNGEIGVSIEGGTSNVVGGTEAGARNVISANGTGVTFLVNQNELLGNLIGTDITGTAPLGNGVGVFVTGSNKTIGGTGSGEGNIIAFNSESGVLLDDVEGGTGLTIRGNSFHDNGGLGIDLGGDGVTANDSGDSDTGVNGLQNFPELTTVIGGSSTQVSGRLNSSAQTTFTLDFYASAMADPSGFGEGSRYLGPTMVTTDSSGNVDFTITIPAATTSSEVVTATATDSSGNTSEFSLALTTTDEVVDIDLVPGDLTNTIDLNSTGTFALAVLSTPSFDATTVDTSDLSQLSFGDTAGPARVSPEGETLGDVDGDGDLDRVLIFSIPAVVQEGALTDSSSQVEFTGFTFDGTKIQGLDSVTVIPLNHPPALTINTGFNVNQGESVIIFAAALTAEDPDGDPVTFTVTGAPSHGGLRLSGNPVLSFTQADINAGLLEYVQDGTSNTADTFAITISDGKLDAGPFTVDVAINTNPTVTLEPVDQTAFAGTVVTFKAAAEGSPVPTVQWQVSTDGGQSFTDIAGASSSVLSFKVDAFQSGQLYRAIFTNPAGTATTRAATLTVAPGLQIVTDPDSQSAPVGTTAIFTAAAIGTKKPHIQWQVSQDNGLTFSNIPGAGSLKLRVKALATADGNLYRAVFTNSAGSAATTAAGLTVDYSVTVRSSRRRLAVPVGADVSLIGLVSGLTAPTVQWEMSADKGKTYTALTGETSPSLSFTASLADSGVFFRAVFAEGTKVRHTAAVVLTVGYPPTVTAPPADVAVPAHETAEFSLGLAGTPVVKVQWQISIDGGKTFSNIRGAVKPTLSLKRVRLTLTGNLYRAVLTNEFDQIVSPAAVLTVN